MVNNLFMELDNKYFNKFISENLQNTITFSFFFFSIFQHSS